MIRRWCLVGALVLNLLTPDTAHAAITRRAARKLIHFTNVTRVAHHVHALDASRRLNHLAQVHTRAMAQGGRLRHRSTPLCRYWGENVGVGATAWGLHRAFMHSAGHRRNILDGHFRRIGVGAIRQPDGDLWVTVEFCR